MKNKDEFRRLVWEKAERYEAQQRIKKKKIRESILLCSICICIAVGAYFGTTCAIFHPALATEEGNDTAGLSEITENIASTTGEADTGAMDSSTGRETTKAQDGSSQDSGETGITSSTVVTSSTISTSKSSVQTTRPETPGEAVIRLDFSFTSSPRDSEAETQAAVFDSLSALSSYLEELHDEYNVPNLYVNSILTSYDDEYFQQYSLVAVKIKDTHECRFASSLSGYQADGSLLFSFARDPAEASEPAVYHFFVTVDKGNYSDIEIITK